ncbi:acyl--CoA ligase [Streptomyces sp. ISL-66]|uniref:class I adenylate-forming enzyme family protein n=1 Tax=Streptomyces sp. ISL-66 TaxID=2819186 RepID=UPI001BEAA43A|nr:class I adenylate-forming enzyme family protein [Streptomyces sp. ISL-66]MBT2466870.1 acyl--CoA ligase [Streptomyces sp. ISL-66]
MIKLDDIRRHAAGGVTRDALVDGQVRLTWGQFAETVERTAAGLSGHLPPGDGPVRAVFLAGNSWQLAVAMSACATLGVSCTGLDPDSGPDDLGQVLTWLEPAVVFVTSGHRATLDQLVWPSGPQALHVLLDGVSAPGAQVAPTAHQPLNFDRLASSEPLRTLPAPRPYESFAVASRSDGPSRIAVRRTPTEGRQLVDLVDEFGLNRDDVHLASAPPAQSTALALTRTMLGVGATVVLADGVGPQALSALLVDERVTSGVITPSTLHALLALPETAEPSPRTRHLRFLLTPGAHLGRWSVNTAWERLGPVLHTALGSAETGLSAVMGPEELLVSPPRSGHATLGTAVAVLGEDGRPLDQGETGRLAFAGHQVMDGYLDGETNTTTLDLGAGEQRFLVTDEAGYVDGTGRLVVTGRVTEVPVVVRDSAVDTELFRLESDLLNLPCLRDTAVMRVSSAVLGDAIVVPFIAVAVGREATGYQALNAACARRVPSLQAHVIAVDTIPYSPTGRIRTGDLLDAVLPIITLNLQLEQSMQQEMSA